MIHRFVSHNGRIREAGEAMLSPGQLGLLAGWGVFSTLRVDAGVLFEWDRHWARMSRDAKLMNVPMPDDGEAVRRDLVSLIEANRAQEGTVRLVVVRNGGGMWEGPPNGHPSDVVALTADKNRWGASVRLTYQSEARHSKSDFTRAKILSWSENLCWYERAHQRGFDECILLNELGEVTECTSANVFAVKDGKAWTAPLSSGCLPGITREVLLHEVRVPGIETSERVLYPEDLDRADEVFITSTTRDLLPVSAIDDRQLGTSGSVRSALLQAFRNHLAAYGRKHRSLYPMAGVGAAR